MYRFSLHESLTVEQQKFLTSTIPGIKTLERFITSPDNSVEITAKFLKEDGIQHSLTNITKAINYEVYSSQLKLSTINSLFSYQKFIIESASKMNSVLIKAGTGTGKTLVCISIALQNRLSNNNLKDSLFKPKVILICF